MHFTTPAFPLPWPDRQEPVGVDVDRGTDIALQYAQHARAVERYAYALLGNRSEAEDITQECFVRLMQSLHSGTHIERVLPWMLRVTHNLALDLITRRPREVSLEVSQVALLADQTQDPELAASEQERREQVRRALASLSLQELRCWTLRAEGLKYREIAEILGVQVGTVATFLVRAAEKLSSQ